MEKLLNEYLSNSIKDVFKLNDDFEIQESPHNDSICYVSKKNKSFSITIEAESDSIFKNGIRINERVKTTVNSFDNSIEKYYENIEEMKSFVNVDSPVLSSYSKFEEYSFADAIKDTEHNYSEMYIDTINSYVIDWSENPLYIKIYEELKDEIDEMRVTANININFLRIKLFICLLKSFFTFNYYSLIDFDQVLNFEDFLFVYKKSFLNKNNINYVITKSDYNSVSHLLKLKDNNLTNESKELFLLMYKI